MKLVQSLSAKYKNGYYCKFIFFQFSDVVLKTGLGLKTGLKTIF